MEQQALIWPLFWVSIALVISGCAGDKERYPSLATRDAEPVTSEFSVAKAPHRAPLAQNFANQPRITGLTERAKANHASFIVSRSNALQSVKSARGKTSDSAAYTNALVALADLSSLRSETALILGELDLLASKAKTQFAPAMSIVTAQAEVETMLLEQDALLIALQRDLAS